MAKEADNKDRKRRRRKGGLRVPSDNVPRRASQAETGGVVEEMVDTESSNDPRLAVSLASAFGGADDIEEIEEIVEDEDAIEGEPIEMLPEPDEDEEEFELDDDSEAEAEAEAADESEAADDVSEAEAQAPAVDVGPIAMASERFESSGDSVDIAFDEDEDEDEDEEHEGEIVDEQPGVPEAVEGPAADEVVAKPVDDEQVARALDGAIEDVSEEVELIPEGPRTDEVEAQEAPAEADDEGEDADRDASLMPAVTEDDVASDEPAEEPERAAEAEAEATAESPPVEAEAFGARVEPGDSSDSGELLTDDLIEEFDSSSISQPGEIPPPPEVPDVPAEPAGQGGNDEVEVAGGRAATVIEPVEELAPSDVVEVEGQPEPPPAPSPPPPRPAAPVTVRPKAKPKPPPAPPPSAAAAAAAAAAAQPRPAVRRKGKPWFEEIFDEDYLRTLPFLTPRETQRQALFVVDALGVEPGASVLDLGCGYGRHAMELAARGLHVVGLDASLPLLIRGADEAQRRGLTINFVHGDMRELTFEEQFDGAYCLFGTFGYFDDDTNKKTAQAVARSLRPGGRFVVEVLNRDYLIADLPSRVWWEGDGCVVLEEVEFNYFSSRIVSSRSVVFDDGRQLEQEISLRAYSLHELGKLLHAAGFRILEISGSMDTKGRFFGADSREIVVVCEKRPASTGGADGNGSGNGSGNGVGDGHTGTTPGTGNDS